MKDTDTGEQQGHPISKEAINQLQLIRQQTLREHQEKLFEDSSKVIRHMREERTEYLKRLGSSNGKR